jgi:hypothetical protein
MAAERTCNSRSAPARLQRIPDFVKRSLTSYLVCWVFLLSLRSLLSGELTDILRQVGVRQPGIRVPGAKMK